jgi:prepilin-type N-terminal cleavage/methylation domain-containing protein
VNRSRHGYSLLEMLVVIAVMSVMVILGTLTVALLMRSDRNGSDALVTAIAGHRLARQFRDDVHRAHNATLEADNGNQPVLRLMTEQGTTISWKRVEDGVRRTVDGDRGGIETYRITSADVAFVISPAPADSVTRRLVSIQATPVNQPTPHTIDNWPLRVTAVLKQQDSP